MVILSWIEGTLKIGLVFRKGEEKMDRKGCLKELVSGVLLVAIIVGLVMVVRRWPTYPKYAVLSQVAVLNQDYCYGFPDVCITGILEDITYIDGVNGETEFGMLGDGEFAYVVPCCFAQKTQSRFELWGQDCWSSFVLWPEEKTVVVELSLSVDNEDLFRNCRTEVLRAVNFFARPEQRVWVKEKKGDTARGHWENWSIWVIWDR